MVVKRITRMALLSAIALAIFWVEAQIPVPIPIPGVKLGLANVVTIFAVFALGPWEAAGILLVRILLGSLLFGQMMGLWYALAGGALAWLATWGLRRILNRAADLGCRLPGRGGAQLRANWCGHCRNADACAPVLFAGASDFRTHHRPVYRPGSAGIAASVQKNSETGMKRQIFPIPGHDL